MSSTTTLRYQIEDLCSMIRDGIRELRCHCDRMARGTTITHSIFPDAAPQLQSMATSFAAIEELLRRLRVEVQLITPTEDLGALTAHIDEDLCTIQTSIFIRGWTLPDEESESIMYDMGLTRVDTMALAEHGAKLQEEIESKARIGNDLDDPTGRGPSASAQLHKQLVAQLATEGGSDCPICLEAMVAESATSPIITKCGHVYCDECIHIHLAERDFCPMCRRDLPVQFLFKSEAGSLRKAGRGERYDTPTGPRNTNQRGIWD